MKLKRILYIILGCAGVGLGAVGAVLPLLPAFPFLLLAAFCFAKAPKNCTAGLPAPSSTKTTWKAMSRARA